MSEELSEAQRRKEQDQGRRKERHAKFLRDLILRRGSASSCLLASIVCDDEFGRTWSGLGHYKACP